MYKPQAHVIIIVEIIKCFLFTFSDLNKLEEGLGEKVSMFIHFQATFLASLILALVKGWQLALICLISLPVTMIAIGIVALV